MSKTASATYAAVVMAVIVAVDYLFLRHFFLARLAIDVTIAALFAALYFILSNRR